MESHAKIVCQCERIFFHLVLFIHYLQLCQEGRSCCPLYLQRQSQAELFLSFFLFLAPSSAIQAKVWSHLKEWGDKFQTFCIGTKITFYTNLKNFQNFFVPLVRLTLMVNTILMVCICG